MWILTKLTAKAQQLAWRFACLLALLDSGFVYGLETESDQEARQSIALLIEQLGSDNYATRIEAENALRQLGVRALDQLKDARSHSNQQIARSADYLLLSNDVVWFYEGDSPRVRKLLRSYGTDNPMERANTLQRLSVLEGDEGIAAVARIARYEANGDLAKRAALSLMRLPDAYMTLEQLKSRWSTIRSVVESGKNSASQWLVHVADLYDRALSQPELGPAIDLPSIVSDLNLIKPIPASDYEMPPLGLIKLQSYPLKIRGTEQEVAWWKTQIDAELALLQKPNRETSLEVADDLCRTAAEFLLRCNNKKDAKLVAGEIGKLPSNVTDLHRSLKRATWAIDFGFPELAVELLEAKPPASVQPQVADMLRSYRGSAYWQYHLAEAYRWMGKLKEAEEIAQQALASPESYIERRETIKLLSERCQFEWAEKEYAQALKTTPTSDFRLFVAFEYINFLKDGREYDKAYKIYEEYFLLLTKDEKFRKEIDESRFGFNLEFLRADYLYVTGMAQVERKEYDEAKKSFREAIELQPENVDVIIEMFRMDGDEAYRQEVQRLIDESLEMLMAEAKTHEAELHQSGVEDFASSKHAYANSLNTYAWLLCNVDRNLEFALNTSILSNRIEPEKPEYADTLAKCYFVAGDLRKAIYWQERALSYSPSQRQLLITLLDYYNTASAQAKQ